MLSTERLREIQEIATNLQRVGEGTSLYRTATIEQMANELIRLRRFAEEMVSCAEWGPGWTPMHDEDLWEAATSCGVLVPWERANPCPDPDCDCDDCSPRTRFAWADPKEPING